MMIQCFNLTGSKTALIWSLDSASHPRAAAGASQARHYIALSCVNITDSLRPFNTFTPCTSCTGHKPSVQVGLVTAGNSFLLLRF